jgi:hypothetical protein
MSYESLVIFLPEAEFLVVHMFVETRSRIDLRRYSQSGNDQDEMVEIKKSRVSCYIFSIFMNNLIQWRKSEAGCLN